MGKEMIMEALSEQDSMITWVIHIKLAMPMLLEDSMPGTVPAQTAQF